jgi:hypothetical protein
MNYRRRVEQRFSVALNTADKILTPQGAITSSQLPNRLC